MKASDIFIKCLQTYGVEEIFAVPGEENLDLVQSIKDFGIKMTVTRNEQSAVFMAATYGRLTGKPGIALATLGPGSTNTMTGIAYAQLGGMPVIVITGQKPIRTSKQGAFQIIDVVSMTKPITKFSTSISDGARIASNVAYAFELATEERPGAVHLELPEDIAGQEIDDIYAEPIIGKKIRRPLIDKKGLKQIITALEKAKYPLILVGAGANRKRISNYLTKFVTKHNIPVFASQMGKGVIDERLNQYIGTAALTSNDYLHTAIEQSDLILAVGHDVIEKPTNIIEQGKTKVIHINFTTAKIDMLYSPYIQAIGDIGNTFWKLFESKINTSNWNIEKIYELANQGKKQKSQYEQTMKSDSCFVLPRLVQEVRDGLGDNDIVALDNGLYKVWFARNYETRVNNTLLLDNALATMGAGYSSAIIAKKTYPDRRVVAVVGDGGLMMNLGDLVTAVRLQLDLTILVLNDNAYGMIKRKQNGHNFDNWGLDLKNPDFVKLAESMGAKGYRIKNLEDFTPLFAKVGKEKGIHLIEIPIVYATKFFE